MKEYLSISDMPHIKEIFLGYKIIEKDCYIIPINKSVDKNIIIEENTNIVVMNENSPNLAGLIIEKHYACFFLEVFAKENKTNKKIRAGIFLVVLEDQNILKWNENKIKLEIETKGGNGYSLLFYDFKEQKIKSVIRKGNEKANDKVMSWYLSAMSQFLDIYGMCQMSPSDWKP